MDMISTLSILSGVAGLHNWFTGITSSKILDQLLKDNKILHDKIEKISDRLFYIDEILEVKDRTKNSQEKLVNKRELREVLEPIQKCLNEYTLSTSVISTPHKLISAMTKDPWQVLFNITSINNLDRPTNPEAIPILFTDSDKFYVGWQMKGTLPLLFDCEYDPDTGLLLAFNSLNKNDIKVKSEKHDTDNQIKTTKSSKYTNKEIHLKENNFKIPIKSPDIKKSKVMDEIEFIFIPGGTFEMGDVFGDGQNIERPVHRVKIEPFYLSKYPITFKQFDPLKSYGGEDDNHWGRGNRPVINVNWYGAKDFCRTLSEQTGKYIRLPTEAEWEYAARECGKEIKWAGTNNPEALGNYAWYDKNSDDTTHPVGEKMPNELGLYDMCGNVSEWCASHGWMWNKYEEGTFENSLSLCHYDAFPDGQVCIRGGAYNWDALKIRCSFRGAYMDDEHYLNIGFRCALSVLKK